MAVFLILATSEDKCASQKEGKEKGTPEEDTNNVPRDTPPPLLSREKSDGDDDNDEEEAIQDVDLSNP